MWSYYGAKGNIVDHYPPPRFNKIIEPFAGTARYSLKYWDREIVLIDKYEVIIKIWKWLQMCSKQDILKLPILKEGELLTDYNFDCQEERLLMGFIIAKGGQSPRNKASKRATTDRPNTINFHLNKIANNLHKIKHWQIRMGKFSGQKNEKATWFIDPPYQFGGDVYNESNKNFDYFELAEWCRSRAGQIIVCENTKADWLLFKPMIQQKGSVHKTTEAIWSNYKTNFDNIQQSLQ